MPPTPNKLNLSFARNAYNVFGARGTNTTTDHQREQKTELLEGKELGSTPNYPPQIIWQQFHLIVLDDPFESNRLP